MLKQMTGTKLHVKQSNSPSTHVLMIHIKEILNSNPLKDTSFTALMTL